MDGPTRGTAGVTTVALPSLGGGLTAMFIREGMVGPMVGRVPPYVGLTHLYGFLWGLGVGCLDGVGLL